MIFFSFSRLLLSAFAAAALSLAICFLALYKNGAEAAANGEMGKAILFAAILALSFSVTEKQNAFFRVSAILACIVFSTVVSFQFTQSDLGGIMFDKIIRIVQFVTDGVSIGNIVVRGAVENDLAFFALFTMTFIAIGEILTLTANTVVLGWNHTGLGKKTS